MQVANRVAAADRARTGGSEHLREETALEIGRVSKPEEGSEVIPIVVPQASASVAADKIQGRLGWSCSGGRVWIKEVVWSSRDTENVVHVGDLYRQSVRNRWYAPVIP